MTLKELSALVQHGSAPDWLREAVAKKRDEMISALLKGHGYTLWGPDKEGIIINPSGTGLLPESRRW